MRPILLRMAAFGPFAAVEEIDFRQLGTNPLFLINGPTGAGKSTILDAICFALYGETTGNEREAKEMRCDHADPATLTEVTLEFELANSRYRISRIPDQSRPKSRGEGTTEQKSRAELYRLEGDEEILLVAPKITEATEEIVNLTGLSAEQFRQVMVLPQGKFRDLLLAKSDEREAIFQQLFQTHVYSTLQTKLREQANALTAQIKLIEGQQKALLEVQDLENTDQLNDELETLKKQLILLVTEKKESEENLKKSQVVLQQAQQLEKAFIEQQQAQVNLADIQGKEPVIEKQKTALELAKKAAEIEPLYQDTIKQKTALDVARKQVTNGRLALDKVEKSLSLLETEKQHLPEKEKALEKFNADIIILGNYRQRIQQLQISQKALVSAEQVMTSSNKKSTDTQKKLSVEKEKLQKAEVQQQANINAIGELSEKKTYLEKLEEKGKSIRKITDLQSELNEANKIIVTLAKNEDIARQDYQKKSRDKELYEQVWNKGQAAILAANLQENSACPVCGSLHHPDTANSHEKLPTEQELNSIRQEAEKYRVLLEKISREKLLKEEEVKNLIKHLNQEKESSQRIESSQGIEGPQRVENPQRIESPQRTDRNQDSSVLSLDDIRHHFQKCRAEIITLQKINDALPQSLLEIEENKKRITKLESELEAVQKIVTETHGIFTAAAIDVKNKKSELPELYRESTALEKEISSVTIEQGKLKKAIDGLNQRYQQSREASVSAKTALVSIKENENTAEKQYQQAVECWDAGLKASPFDDETVFLQSRLEKNVAEQQLRHVRQHEDDKLLLRKQLEEKTALIVDKTRPDINQLAETEKQLLVAKELTDSAYHKTQQRQHLLTTIRDKLKQSLEQQTKLESEYGVVGKLSDISNGKNPHNLSLQRFVLSVLLDDVLTEASSRLLKMSKGRYQLYRKETVGDKRTKAGLELEVEDAYTGKQRPAATLSGGESFMAALALALGLSDVVQAYAGGIRLDMLFIDEGFGSLDPESLELAINTLLDLRDSGRMVGIISHVEELKRMIDVRLDVVANREVSTTQLVGV